VTDLFIGHGSVARLLPGSYQRADGLFDVTKVDIVVSAVHLTQQMALCAVHGADVVMNAKSPACHFQKKPSGEI